MFSVFEKVAGRLFSVVEPLKLGPRQCGQFSAWQEKAIRNNRRSAAVAFFIVFGFRVVCMSSAAIATLRTKSARKDRRTPKASPVPVRFYLAPASWTAAVLLCPSAAFLRRYTSTRDS